MSFDLGNYVEVKDRIAEFWTKFPDGRILCTEPQPVVIGEGRWFIASHARVFLDRDDTMPVTSGSAWEQFPGQTPYTRNSEAMNAETSAIGRALGALGIGIGGSMASRDEVQNRQAERAVPQVPDGKAVANAKRDLVDELQGKTEDPDTAAKTIWEMADLTQTTATIGDQELRWLAPEELEVLERVTDEWLAQHADDADPDREDHDAERQTEGAA